MSSTAQYITTSFFWSCISKVLDALCKFISIPLLLVYFGKTDYSLITLAIATNAYMQLLNMGMNTGGVKFYSQWISQGNYSLLDKVARTNITFYVFIGALNSTVLLILAYYADEIFQISPSQMITFRALLIIQSLFSVFSWVNLVFQQLLMADEKIAFTQKILSLRSILDLLLVLLVVRVQITIEWYFLSTMILSFLLIVPFCWKCFSRGLLQSFIPAFYWSDFSILFKYSLGIFAMSIFQFSSTQTRPLILGMFNTDGVNILADYRVIEVFPLFIISIGGMLISILLPKASRAIFERNRSLIERLAYEGTKYSSILVACLCFPLMLITKELLLLYVGVEYVHLSFWMALWIFTIVLFLHNAPVASLVLATGKTRMLVLSSFIACLVSIVINVFLCRFLGVGSAVVGYLVYIVIQMMFYYFYFNSKVLNLKSLKVFYAFLIPTLCGAISYVLVECIVVFFKMELFNAIGLMAIKVVSWFIVFCSLVLCFKVITENQIKEFMHSYIYKNENK